jgi:uncharacterized membrane protein
MSLVDFLSKEEQERIVAAITEAERLTSGEICVHVAPSFRGDVMKRAVSVFNRLKLYKTLRRNAVLVYVSYKKRGLAIIGDCGINDVVPNGFWDKEKETLARYLADGRQCDGLCEVVKEIGESLSSYFPADAVDNNELSNEITYDD